MEESLRQNELRAINYIGAPNQPGDLTTEQNFKLVSVSPYRANVQMIETRGTPMDHQNRDNECNAEYQEEEENAPMFEGDQHQDYRKGDVSPLQQFKRRRPSPIKDDSIYLREKGDQFLNSFCQGVSKQQPAQRMTAGFNSSDPEIQEMTPRDASNWLQSEPGCIAN